MNEWEKACKEFLKGCLNVEANKQETCSTCLTAFCNQLRFLAEKDKTEVNIYCMKSTKPRLEPLEGFK